MAIGTYDELKTAIQSWMADRSDIPAQADNFIDLAEADINDLLRVRQMETSTTLTPDSDGQASLPSDYLEWRSVIWAGSPRRQLKLISPDLAEEWYGYRESDDARFFTISGSTLQVLPVSTTSIEFVYYQKLTALSDSNTTTWLLSRAPNAYLFGALRYAAAWVRDEAEEGRYLQRFHEQIQKLNMADKGERWARGGYVSHGQKP